MASNVLLQHGGPNSSAPRGVLATSSCKEMKKLSWLAMFYRSLGDRIAVYHVVFKLQVPVKK